MRASFRHEPVADILRKSSLVIEGPVLSPHSVSFIAALKAIVGDAQVLTDAKATRAYRIGFRCGGGAALAVVRPR